MKKKSKPNGPEKMKAEKYEKELRKLQVQLCHLQDWVKQKGLRVIVIFDAATLALLRGVDLRCHIQT
jgi:polyphosphate kinase 2 (PPK2 family)